MQLRDCTHDEHADEMLAILNEAIVGSTALYDYRPRSADSMRAWFRAKEAGGFPVIGAFEGPVLLGFASWGGFRAWPAYKYTVEHSVYVHRDHRRRGVGAALLAALVDAARQRQVHVMVGGIDAGNAGSIALHRRLGFVHAGTIRQAGFKFGRWLDLEFHQLTLQMPQHPVDG